MYRVTKGNKILNVSVEGTIKHFYEGDKLPSEYKPPADYLSNGIIEKIKKRGK